MSVELVIQYKCTQYFNLLDTYSMDEVHRGRIFFATISDEAKDIYKGLFTDEEKAFIQLWSDYLSIPSLEPDSDTITLLKTKGRDIQSAQTYLREIFITYFKEISKCKKATIIRTLGSLTSTKELTIIVPMQGKAKSKPAIDRSSLSNNSTPSSEESYHEYIFDNTNDSATLSTADFFQRYHIENIPNSAPSSVELFHEQPAASPKNTPPAKKQKLTDFFAPSLSDIKLTEEEKYLQDKIENLLNYILTLEKINNPKNSNYSNVKNYITQITKIYDDLVELTCSDKGKYQLDNLSIEKKEYLFKKIELLKSNYSFKNHPQYEKIFDDIQDWINNFSKTQNII